MVLVDISVLVSDSFGMLCCGCCAVPAGWTGLDWRWEEGEMLSWIR